MREEGGLLGTRVRRRMTSFIGVIPEKLLLLMPPAYRLPLAHTSWPALRATADFRGFNLRARTSVAGRRRDTARPACPDVCKGSGRPKDSQAIRSKCLRCNTKPLSEASRR